MQSSISCSVTLAPSHLQARHNAYQWHTDSRRKTCFCFGPVLASSRDWLSPKPVSYAARRFLSMSSLWVLPPLARCIWTATLVKKIATLVKKIATLVEKIVTLVKEIGHLDWALTIIAGRLSVAGSSGWASRTQLPQISRTSTLSQCICLPSLSGWHPVADHLVEDCKVKLAGCLAC